LIDKRLLVLLAAVLWGCSGRTIVPLTEIDDLSQKESYFVTTTDGRELEFVVMKSQGDTLLGTVRMSRSRVVSGAEGRVEVRNEYRELVLPVSDVRKIEVQKSGPRTLLLLAASVAAIGGIYALVANSDGGSEGDGGGDGREPPPLPAPPGSGWHHKPEP
jgi:hypothetical protein